LLSDYLIALLNSIILNKRQIQVLDDSNDETASIHQRVSELQLQGFDIEQVRRSNREGFSGCAFILFTISRVSSLPSSILIFFPKDF
jgi:hypothetical protein